MLWAPLVVVGACGAPLAPWWWGRVGHPWHPGGGAVWGRVGHPCHHGGGGVWGTMVFTLGTLAVNTLLVVTVAGGHPGHPGGAHLGGPRYHCVISLTTARTHTFSTLSSHLQGIFLTAHV